MNIDADYPQVLRKSSNIPEKSLSGTSRTISSNVVEAKDSNEHAGTEETHDQALSKESELLVNHDNQQSEETAN